jgi:hypothetical protein
MVCDNVVGFLCRAYLDTMIRPREKAFIALFIGFFLSLTVFSQELREQSPRTADPLRQTEKPAEPKEAPIDSETIREASREPSKSKPSTAASSHPNRMQTGEETKADFNSSQAGAVSRQFAPTYETSAIKAPGAKISADPDMAIKLDRDGDLSARPVPDYDGRGSDPTTAGDVLIWVPRVLLSPLYLVSEYAIRQPLGALTTVAEENNWPAILVGFFTFGEELKVGLFPTFYAEFGVEPSVGAYFFADDVGIDGHDIRVHGGMWPADWWSLSIKERSANKAKTLQLAMTGNITQRPDFLFTGLGPESSSDDESYYESTIYQLDISIESDFFRNSSAGFDLGIRRVGFDAESDFGDTSMAERVQQGAYDLPPGFEDGYTAMRQEVDFVLDTRLPRPAPGHGFRLELNAEHAWDIQSNQDHSWVKYGGAVGGFWDIFGEHRVISLFIEASFADPVNGEVPFSELSTLGGGGRPLFQGFQTNRRKAMEGFPEGRLIDRSAIAGTFEYRWPVWIWLDMAARFSIGNVFGKHLSGFDWELLRTSFGVGLRSSIEVDSSVNLLVAFGTETFGQGTEIDSFRLAVGWTRGF